MHVGMEISAAAPAAAIWQGGAAVNLHPPSDCGRIDNLLSRGRPKGVLPVDYRLTGEGTPQNLSNSAI